MKNSLLVILWVIILGGGYFIYQNSQEPDAQDPVIRTETAVTQETEYYDGGDKTFNEYINQGDTHLQKGEIEAAILNYQSAARLNNNSAPALLRLGNAYLFNDQPKEAEIAFQKALILEPASNHLQLRIVQAKLDQRAIEQARALTWELPENDYEVQYYRGLLEVLYKNFSEAKDIFENLSEANDTEEQAVDTTLQANAKLFLKSYSIFSYYTEGEQEYLQTLLAKDLTAIGQYQAAIPLLFDVLNSNETYRDAWIVLGYAYLNTKQNAAAIEAFETAQDLGPNKPETMFFLGLAHFANNEIEKAIIALEKADQLGYQPKDQIQLKLGDLYLLQEEYGKAETSYRNVLSANPSNIDVFTRSVWLNIDKLGDADKALELAHQALEHHSQNPMSYNLVGWALTATKDYNQAEKYLTKALEMDPNLDAAYLNFGWLYEQQGASTLAKEYYKEAYELGGTNSIANLAALRFNNLSKPELRSSFGQVNVTAPNRP